MHYRYGFSNPKAVATAVFHRIIFGLTESLSQWDNGNDSMTSVYLGDRWFNMDDDEQLIDSMMFSYEHDGTNVNREQIVSLVLFHKDEDDSYRVGLWVHATGIVYEFKVITPYDTDRPYKYGVDVYTRRENPMSRDEYMNDELSQFLSKEFNRLVDDIIKRAVRINWHDKDDKGATGEFVKGDET